MPKEKEMNIYQKLAKVRKAVEVIQRNKQGYGYSYVSDDEILAKLTVLMDKLGLSLVPRFVPGTRCVEPFRYSKTKFDKTTKTTYTEEIAEIVCHAEMTYTWVNNDNPEECVEVPWIMIGQQADASQSFGSGLTYAYRYFLLKYFGIATPDDDPDKWRSKQKDAEKEEDKLIAAEIIEELDTLIRTFISTNPDKKETVKTLVTAYVKSGDYKKIAEPALAAKLLADFKENFVKEK